MDEPAAPSAAVEGAKSVVDRWLDSAKTRTQFSGVEVRDMLLDIRAGIEVDCDGPGMPPEW